MPKQRKRDGLYWLSPTRHCASKGLILKNRNSEGTKTQKIVRPAGASLVSS